MCLPHERISTRTAVRDLYVGLIECDALVRNALQIRSVHDRVAVHWEIRSHVVRHDQEHVLGVIWWRDNRTSGGRRWRRAVWRVRALGWGHQRHAAVDLAAPLRVVQVALGRATLESAAEVAHGATDLRPLPHVSLAHFRTEDTAECTNNAAAATQRKHV